MGYPTVEDALIDTIRRVGFWTTINTSASDWDLINKGKSRYLITRPGVEAEVARLNFKGNVSITPWSIMVEIWRLHETPKDVRRLQEDVEKTIAKIEEYPHLGKGVTGNIHRAEIISVGEIEGRWTSNNSGPNWLVQELTMICTEERRTTFAE